MDLGKPVVEGGSSSLPTPAASNVMRAGDWKLSKNQAEYGSHWTGSCVDLMLSVSLGCASAETTTSRIVVAVLLPLVRILLFLTNADY